MMSKEILDLYSAQIRSAKITDAPLIEKLLWEGAKSGSVLPRPVEEIEKVIDGFVVMENHETGNLSACASVEIYDEAKPELDIAGLAELRSVVSLQKGAGPLIVAKALERAKRAGIKDVFATTDNPDFFAKYCGFTVEKGGTEIAWMDLDKKSGAIFRGNGVNVRETNIADFPVISKLLYEDAENVLPLSEKALQYRLNSYYLAVNQDKQILGCVGAFIYSAAIPGGQPRMAEVRGLTVDNGYDRTEIQNILLDHAWNKFKTANVKQAFITASATKRAELIASGYFKDVPGGKQVLWWSGSQNAIIMGK